MAMNTEVLSIILQIYFKIKRRPEFKKKKMQMTWSQSWAVTSSNKQYLSAKNKVGSYADPHGPHCAKSIFILTLHL